MLTVEASRERLSRLQTVLQQQNLDAAVIGFGPHVYYFSSFLVDWLQLSALALTADGASILIAPNKAPSVSAAGEIGTYEARWNATLRPNQAEEVAGMLVRWLTQHRAQKVGMDTSLIGSQFAMRWNGPIQSLDSHVWQMRRAKDPDELALMRTAISCTTAMYQTAKQILRPGIQELEMFSELHKAAVLRAGEPLSALLGNDFQSGSGGGAPRKDRAAQAGELYVLDLGPAYRGYFADNCRTFSVDGSVSTEQQRAFDAIAGVFPLIEKTARPGVRCRELFAIADEQLQSHYGKPLKHHLGHGVGLQPHEYPHLNPKWDDVLLEGEVFTAEPGLYGPELRDGIRIEQNYLVTANGVESLLDFPIELV
ncbi:MAG TPA: Xaa-Pro peptidase family protein [Tepidisphaeraceae bacterium]|jgi:Xaa-Pro aminopeptidase